ncbi:DNA-directed RNA polymerase subunit omega [Haloplasma contractile]|uniref:DNA-directed RNA polymerase subunit omega n=1 Tax=Haloplasma contractile SSD-17B TaxID=1033810 RepID=U2EFH7_9MOLU|nr:DNA-directed RNA polymerase subunit omega [Haloplasma contractile]ERJ13416.1 DNA-directed RNA polymerase subunit omega protein [Haloplasma contractile SSD-17B]
MRNPSIDQLLEKIDSKYKLAYASAKRARQLSQGQEELVDRPYSRKEVGIALEEILEDKLDIEFEE